MINVSHLTKIYKAGDVEVKALDDISFSIEKGEFVAIMGPSGSGKSTLMHILGVLDIPSFGEYTLDGAKIARMDEDSLAEIRNTKIGFVFQSYNLLPRTTSVKNVSIPMMYAGINKKERTEKAIKFLETVGLGDRLYHTPSQLSGGQQQRVAIARALTMNPKILLADEPTGNIASKQAEEIMGIFEDLHSRGNTIIMITHEPDIAAFAKRIIQLKDGKIISDKKNGHRKTAMKRKSQ